MKIELNEEQKESLITSLLGFVRRVAFQGAEQPDEALAFFLVVNLLLCDCESETEESQESENSG